MRESFLETRGICYRRNEFRPDRPTLVWIHGLSGSASAWFPYEETFAEYNLLTYDLRGHGFSLRPRHYEEYAIGTHADDLVCLLDHLNIATCTLISHSFGALVAAEVLKTHSHRVSSTIFLSPAAALHRGPWYAPLKVLGRLGVGLCKITPFRSQKRGRVDYSLFSYTSDWDLRRIVRDVYNTTVHSYLYSLSQAYAVADDLSIPAPTPALIIHGTQDSYVPIRFAEQLAASSPHASLIRLEGANHIIVLNNREDVARHITHFLHSTP